MEEHPLDGIRVVEIADEQAEYTGLLLAGMGAEVIKVEPPGGSPTRHIGPFYHDVDDPEHSLFFWQYNRGKRSVMLDLGTETDRQQLLTLLSGADVLVDSTPYGYMTGLGLGLEDLASRFPRVVLARMSPFGDDGPWATYRGSDLVHLALGGEMMNCGYDPRPDGTYDLPPIAGQMWHAYHIAGEQLLTGILAALYYREDTGEGQIVRCAIHDCVAKNTEIDVMNWVMRRLPTNRQTAAHAREVIQLVPPLMQSKDGRWFMSFGIGARDRSKLLPFLEQYGMESDLKQPAESSDRGGRALPGTLQVSEQQAHLLEVLQRLFRKYTAAEAPWVEAQEAGLMVTPVRRPDENIGDEHWQARGTFTEIEHPEHGRAFTYATSKWISTETSWVAGRRAPLINEDGPALLAEAPSWSTPPVITKVPATPRRLSARGRPFVLDGIRIFDFGWFLATAGGSRFLAAMGAESIKVEWAANPDTRLAVMAPIGGREARRNATGPLQGVKDADMGGQFNNKNAGKRGISLNVRHPKGLDIARRLIAISDIVAEGFSPGVMNRWGLGYDALKEINPRIIYVQQSGMGAAGTYGRFRAVGPIAASLAGTTDMAGLPEPVGPSGWGYSFLDWIGAYSFANAMLSALLYRERTGKGQWIDASQTETGIFVSGTAFLNYSANGRSWQRYGNRSPYKLAAPHGAYRCAGEDHWVAIACFTDEDWRAVVKVAGHPEWETDRRFHTLRARLQHQDELDETISSWTRINDRYDIMHMLQHAGVAAGVCQTGEDKVDRDPQLAALEWLTEVTGTKIGTWPVCEVPVNLEKTPAYIGGPTNRGAPNYGEDNEYIFGELLGMSTKEIAALAEEGVI